MRLTAACVMVVLAAGSARAEALPERSFHFTYKVAVDSIPPGAESIKVWVPVPKSGEYQTISEIVVIGAPDHEFVVEEKFGNKFLLVNVPVGTENVAFEMEFQASRMQRNRLNGEPQVDAQSPPNQELFLVPASLIRIEGPVADEARQVVGTVTDPLARARALYDHIVDTVDYDKSGEGWGRGDAQYACDVRKGNCTDFHSLFIGEAISLGLPARFLMGFSIPVDAPEGEIGGYHCWAEFYLDGRGWIPIDASEASKDPSRRDELFGGLDANRVEFTMGRDIEVPGMQGPPLNYSIYPVAEIDGKPHSAIQRSFFYRNLDQETNAVN